MIQYFDNKETACIDDYSFKKDNKTGYYLSSRKIDGKRERLHVYVWEKENGEIPNGMHIHHIDGDKGNNEITNLTMLTAAEHAKIHGNHFSNERKQKMRENLIKNALPKSKEWHKSEKGKEFHSKHAKEMWDSKEEKEYICSLCGEKFKSRKQYSDKENRFCSNKCKSAFRRKSGVDDVERLCECCGKPYKSNKYSKTKYCKDCKNKVNKSRGERASI